MKTTIYLILFCLIVISNSFGQNYPFPQNVVYPFGYSSDIITSNHQQEWYDAWKEKYPQQCSGTIRPGVDPINKSLVEAQGWSMITAAYMGDKQIFDGLYDFYKMKCNSQAGGMMGWKTTCSGYEDMGSATDGDIDVAFSLIVAYWQWGGGYLEEAKKVIKNLEKLIVSCNGGLSALCGGYKNSAWGGCHETDISYYTPAFFRIFAEITDNNTWTKLADDTYTILNNAANNNTGLVPDWHGVNGQPGPNGRCGYYRYDACRVPWRIALDYLWNGNEKALTWCKKISDWAHQTGPENIKDGYNLDGSSNNDGNHNLAFVGGFAVSAMCNSKNVLDDFCREVIKMNDDYWYSGYLGNVYQLTLTGNLWNKDIIDNQVGINKTKKLKFKSDSKVKYLNNCKIAVCGLNDKQIKKVKITDISGKNILCNTVINEQSIIIDIKTLKKNCYILSFIDKNGLSQKVQKVLIF